MPVNGKHLIHLVQHGINPTNFSKIEPTDKHYKGIKERYLGDGDYSYVIGFNSRNAHRKHPSNLIMGFKNFCDNIPEEEAKKCALMLHSDLVCDAGTHLPKVIEAICPAYKAVVLHDQHNPQEMRAFYNVCDVIANVSSNEGFGLSIAESLMCETPVISTVTGGLQDQLGFVDDDGKPVKFDLDFSSNNTGRYKTYGKWAKAIFPRVQTLQGSPPTPYIFDDMSDYTDIADAIMFWYLAGDEKRRECGKEGRRWACNEGGINSENMCGEFIKGMNHTLDNFTPPTAFDVYEPNAYYDLRRLPNDSIGLDAHKIDIPTIQDDANKI
jgi:glycosyltransferase involved in cell wall biosynthesis